MDSIIKKGFVIREIDTTSYYDSELGEFTSKYNDNGFNMATIYDSIEACEEEIEISELDGYIELEIIEVEKVFNILSQYKRVKNIQHIKL